MARWAVVGALLAMPAFVIAAEPKKPNYQKQADESIFKLDERPNALKCVMAYDGKFQVAIHKLNFGNLAIVFKDDQDKTVYTIEGHYRTQFAVINEVVYFTEYNPHSSGCALVAFDLKNKKQVFECNLKGLGPIDHTKYFNDVSMSVADGVIWIYSKESAGRYVEIVDMKTGKTVGNKVFKEKD